MTIDMQRTFEWLKGRRDYSKNPLSYNELMEMIYDIKSEVNEAKMVRVTIVHAHYGYKYPKLITKKMDDVLDYLSNFKPQDRPVVIPEITQTRYSGKNSKKYFIEIEKTKAFSGKLEIFVSKTDD